MRLDILNHNPEKEEAIKAAAENLWNFTNWRENVNGLDCSAEDELAGSESEFAERLTIAIWEANEGYCEVSITATCLEDLPCEEYVFQEDKYERLMGVPVVAK
jgi:hypothetical protein